MNNRKAKYRALKDQLAISKNVGRTLQDLLSRYNDQDVQADLSGIEQVLYPYKGVPASQLGISYAERQSDKKLANDVLMQYDINKLGDGDVVKGLQTVKTLLSMTPLNMHKKMKELIALDDFGGLIDLMKGFMPGVATKVVDLATTVGIPFIKNKISDWLGESSTGNNVQKPNKTVISGPSSTTMQPSVSMLGGRISFDTVNNGYIATVLCPEKFAYRSYVPGAPVKTAIVQGRLTSVLTTDGNGNTAAIIIPASATSLAAQSAIKNGDAFMMINPPSFTPTAGGYGQLTAANFVAGPLSTNVSSIYQYRVVGFSINVVPITSANNSQGNVQLGFFQDITNTTATLVPIPQIAVQNGGWYQSGNLLSTYRAIYLPDYLYDFTPVCNQGGTTPDLAFGEEFYVLITGAAANTNVAKIDISYVYEIIPVNTATQLSFLDYGIPGPATLDALSTMLVYNQGLAMLDKNKAIDLGNKVITASNKYDEILQLVMSETTGVILRDNAPVEVPKGPLDMIYEIE